MQDEAALLKRAQQHDQAALGEIYDHYARRIHRYIYHRTGDVGLADDLTGDVFVRMLEAARSERFAQTSLQAWLYRIAHNLIIDHYRQQPGTPDLPLDGYIGAPADGPAATVEHRLAQERLRAALGLLTEEQQQVIMLRFGEGLTATEVAEVLNKAETAIWALQHRALATLRRILQEEMAG